MPRKVRIEYPGAMYHVMSRGDRREDIFVDDEDRQRFLSTLGEACQKTEWQVHAYCLMRNHFHLVIETPQANLVAGMKWHLGVYTKRFNIRHKLCGHLFAGRYKALVVEGSGNGYLRTVCDYVHLNPVRAKLIKPEGFLESFAWSSYGEYLKPARQRPPWLRVDRLLGGDLQTRRKGDPQKVILARRLREETTMTLKWIAQRLQMGSWTYVSDLLKGRPRISKPV